MTELSYVALYGLLIVATILAQATLATPQLGLPYLATARDDGRVLQGIAGRLLRATINCLIGFALFAAAVLILNAQGRLSPSTLMLAQVVVWTRLAYVVVYGAGIPWVRTVVWLIPTAATAWLLVLAL